MYYGQVLHSSLSVQCKQQNFFGFVEAHLEFHVGSVDEQEDWRATLNCLGSVLSTRSFQQVGIVFLLFFSKVGSNGKLEVVLHYQAIS